MAKSFTVSFNITGALDGSLSAALQTAARQMKALGNAANSLNGKSLKLSQSLGNAQNLLKNIEAYKKLQSALNDTIKSSAQARTEAAKLLRQRTAEQKKLDEMKSAYSQLQQVYRDNRKSMGTDAAAAMKAQLKDARAEIKAQEQSVRSLGTSYNQTNQRVQSLRETQRQQQTQLANLRSTVPSSNIAAAESALRAQIDQTTAALNREIAALQRRNEVSARFNQAQQNMSNAYSNFQNSMQTAETIMSPFAAAAENAMSFEYNMSKVRSLTQMRNIRAGNFAQVEREMADLTAQAERLGATTEFTSNQVAQAMGFYGMAGWDSSRIMAAMAQTVDLATIAGDKNIPRMADVLSDIATAMGVTAGETMQLGNGKTVDAFSHFADSWAYAVTQANVNTEQLFESMKYNAGAMRQAGLTMGDIFASNMVAANAGIKGSMAGTAFRSGVIRLQAPAKAGAKALEEMGASASEAQREMAAAGNAMAQMGIQGGSVMDKIVAIKQKYDENLAAGKTAENAAMINDIFGKNAFQTWAQIMDKNTLADLMRYAEEINSGAVEGWAADTASVMRDNTQTSIELLKSSIDAFQRSVGDALIPTIRRAADAFSPLVTSAGEWIQQNQTAVQYLALLAAGISAVVVAGAGIALVGAAWGMLSSGALAAIGAIRTVGTVLMMVANVTRIAAVASMAWGAITAAAAMIASAPIWLIVAAVTAVVAAILYATGAADGLGAALSEAWNHPQGAITGFANLVNSTINNLVSSVVNRWNTLKSALSHPIDAIINFVDHGDVIGGNVKSGEQQALETQSHVVNANSGGGLGAIQERAAQIDSGNLTIDTSTAQAALDQVAPAATNASTGLDTISQFTQQISTAGFDVTNFTTGLTTSGVGIQTFSTNAGTAGTNVQTLGTSANGAQGNIDALGAVSGGAQGNVGGLGDASGGASGSVSGLGAAASAACAELAAAGANAASAVAAAAASVPTKANYAGGIYPKGKFVTTFAERSPEAAIPINNSNRSRQLWERTGQMLGTLPGTSSGYDSAPKDELGNLADVEEFNRIKAEDDRRVRRLKMQAQREHFERLQAQRAAVQSQQVVRNATAQNVAQTRIVTPESQRVAEQSRQLDAQLRQATDLQSLRQAMDYLPDTPSNRAARRSVYSRRSRSTSRSTSTGDAGRLRQAMDYLPDTPSNRRARQSLGRSQAQSGRLRQAMDYLPDTPSNRRARQSLGRSTRSRADDVRLPSGYTIGDAIKYLPTQRRSSGSFGSLNGNLSGMASVTAPPILPQTPNVGSYGGLGSYGSLGSFGSFGSYGGLFQRTGRNPFQQNPFRRNPLSGFHRAGRDPFHRNPLGSFGSFGGIGLGGLDSGLGLGGLDSGIGGIGLGTLNTFAPNQSSPSTTFNVTINVTANGADEQSIRNGVESAVPQLESWATQFANHQHEQARRSFA